MRVAPGAAWGDHLIESPPIKAGNWYQMWQTVSDKPYTPAFETPEELARWCAAHPWGLENQSPVSYENWLQFIHGAGLAMSAALLDDKIVSGVELANLQQS